MKKSSNRRNTPELIINTSLELFNIRGERNVTTNHIAEQTNLSPGNLYYHYSCKEDIILELIDRYICKINRLISKNLSDEFDFDSTIKLLENIIALRWEYRFIVSGKFGPFLFNEKIRKVFFPSEHDDVSIPIFKIFERMSVLGVITTNREETNIMSGQFTLLQEAWVSMQILNSHDKNDLNVVLSGRNYMLRFIYPNLSQEWKKKCESLFSI